MTQTTEIKIDNGNFTPFTGWRFILDHAGVLHHVPDREILEEMCKLYYGEDYDKPRI